MHSNMRKAIFPGTFDPFTLGHQDMVSRALALFDQLIIAIAQGSHKTPSITLDNRLLWVAECYAHEPRIKVLPLHGLLVDLAKEEQAQIHIS